MVSDMIGDSIVVVMALKGIANEVTVAVAS